MYRAFALKAFRAGLPLDDGVALQELAAETSISLEPGEVENRVMLDGEDVTGLIRNPTVTDAASRVSTFPAIRAWMVRLQQQLGAEGGVVMEGRDIGTVVFPHAPVKIFLDAAPEVRGHAGTSRWVNRDARPWRRRKKFSANCMHATNATAIAPIRRSSRLPTPFYSTQPV